MAASLVGLASFLLLTTDFHENFLTARTVLLTETKAVVTQFVLSTVLIKTTSSVWFENKFKQYLSGSVLYFCGNQRGCPNILLFLIQSAREKGIGTLREIKYPSLCTD